MNTGKQLVVETNLGGGRFSEGLHSSIRSLSGLSAVLFPKTCDRVVISLQCLIAMIFHDIFVRVLRFFIT